MASRVSIAIRTKNALKRLIDVLNINTESIPNRKQVIHDVLVLEAIADEVESLRKESINLKRENTRLTNKLDKATSDDTNSNTDSSH